jgi:PAS domain S-box-containing protein
MSDLRGGQHGDRIEHELRIAEAKATEIVSISADAIISIDADQRISMFNAAAEKIFGYTRAEVIGAALDMLIPERLRASHRTHIERFVADPEVAHRVGDRRTAISGLRKNGEEFPAKASISKIVVDGTTILTVALRDLTEQQRTERDQRLLAEACATLGSSLDYEATLGVIAQLVVRELADFCVVDVVEDTGEVRRLKVASRDPSHAWICERLAQVELDRSRPYLLHGALEQLRPVLRSRLTQDELVRLAQSDHHLQTLQAAAPRSVLAVPLVAHDTLVGAIGLVSSTANYGPVDLQLAEQLANRAALAIDNARQHRAARRATQARDEVLGIVAHDLRSPLNVIGVQVAVLRELADEHKPVIEQITNTVARMSRMLDDLLDVTRLDAGQLSLDRTCVPSPQIVADAVETQRPLVDAAALELRVDVAPQAPGILADRDRLLQVFANLIGNALQFTPSPGCITVGAKPHGTDVLFWVTDTGPGIAREDQPRLFDRFWQAGSARRRGAGLGLSIVRRLVEVHRGRVWVESEPGRGSTFYFTIPAVQNAD